MNKSNTPSNKSPSGGDPEQDKKRWIDRLVGFSFRFERFGSDILGVLLLVFAISSLLGISGLSGGTLLTPWSAFLRKWLGWGCFPAVLFVGVLGYALLSRKPRSPARSRLGRVLAWEGWIFTATALFSAAGGHSLERAEEGLDGGVIGWGLVRLFGDLIPIQVIAIILILLLILFTLLGIGKTGWALAVLKKFRATRQEVNPPAGSAVRKSEEAGMQGYHPLTHSSQEPAQSDPRRVQAAVEELSDRDKRLPPLNLLTNKDINRPDSEDIHATADLIEQTLSEFGVPARVTGFRVGPTVTQFAVEPGFMEKTGANGEVIQQKVRVSQISGLARDLALRLSAQRLRIEAPVAGQSFVGIEVPNDRNAMVRLRAMLESDTFKKNTSPLPLALGKDVSGLPVVGDLTKMPHLLIAGTTGSGKSICIKALTMCLVMNSTPDELRLAMLDPKMVELSRFNGLPHLLGKVETSPERMVAVLNWALAEMGNRYKLLELANARDLETYNRKAVRKGEKKLPRIIVIIDELADLMLNLLEPTENAIVRLAQMARATGIHLIIATQRPSTNVITGLIKANFPTRIAFSVASGVDLRVILDITGAETLLGNGDLLYLNPEVGSPIRAQGVFVTDHEITRVVNFWQKLSDAQDNEVPWEAMVQAAGGEENEDALLKQAILVIKKAQKASASLLQRRMHVGYPRAARLIEQLESLGMVGPAQPGGRDREVLVDPDDDGAPIGLDDYKKI